MRTVLCDDHKVFAEAMAVVLRAKDHQVAVAHRPADVLPIVDQAEFDVCVLDITYPDADGIEFLATYTQQPHRPRVLMLTAQSQPNLLRRCLEAGASGVASKTRGIDDIIHAIERVHRGELHCDDSLLRESFGLTRNDQHQHAQFLASYLTARESQVLASLTEGRTTHEITEKLGIARTTVRTHIQSILHKLGVHSRLEAVTYAMTHNLLNTNPNQPHHGGDS